ncbi:hypothetical protein [Streptomyces sp. NPDC088246]|uniref:hypothetical protein n=1 Tax=Streptomyces sp. NPDC088246 TaxID=3365842 RepID=UPI003827B908
MSGSRWFATTGLVLAGLLAVDVAAPAAALAAATAPRPTGTPRPQDDVTSALPHQWFKRNKNLSAISIIRPGKRS